MEPGGSFGTTIIRLAKLALLKGPRSFCTFRGITVHIPGRHGEIPYCVLGRDYLFRKFTATFKEREQKVTLRGPCQFSKW